MSALRSLSMNESDSLDVNRRRFIKGGSAATLMTMIGGVELLGQTNAPTAAAQGIKPTFKTKVAVIGLGQWGRELLKVLTLVERAIVAAICDHYPVALRRGAEDAPHAEKTADYKTILENKDITAVIIATPPHQHKEIVLAAIKAGKHVYCEAPLAHTVEEAREIALAAKNAPKQIVFQAGLQRRSDAELLFLRPFIRSGALGQIVMARAQWHKKTSWRAATGNPERQKALNWRLYKETSPGLIGEIGIHQIDQASWFLRAKPRAVTGFGSIVYWNQDKDNDDRDVPDTVQAVIEYPEGVNLVYHATLANSFDASYEMFYGSDAAVMLRDEKAWMFKEVDSALLGWEVYAVKETFYKDTGISLRVGASKSAQGTETLTHDEEVKASAIWAALDKFALNAGEVNRAVENVKTSLGDDPEAIAEAVDKARKDAAPAAGYLEGYQATVTALKANEAINQRKRIELKPEWYELT
ncbi:MAG: hypothetical protein C5B50_25505 [Verrucomicrobia bacterium]|nr:MAG: hypothetical protein C5B50_25505 [Verrucomicrobiota bacterium]